MKYGSLVITYRIYIYNLPGLNKELQKKFLRASFTLNNVSKALLLIFR